MNIASKTQCPASARHLHVRVIQDEDGFASVKDRWDLLLDAVEYPMPFLAHDWIRLWRDSFAPGVPFYIITVWEDKTLIAIVPLQRTMCTVLRLFHLSCLKTFVNSDSAISNLICRAVDLVPVLDAVRTHLIKNSSDWNLLLIGYVPYHAGTVDKIAGAFTAKGLAVFVEPRGGAFYSYYLDVEDDFDTFFRGLGPSFKNDQKKKRNRLLRLGRVEFEVMKEFKHEEVDIFFNIEDSGWKGQEGTSIKSSAAMLKFYTGIAQAFSKNGRFALVALRVNGKPLACLYTVLFHNILYPLKIGVNLSSKEYRRISPGQALLDRLIQYCFKEKVKVIDFYGQCYTYESRWTKTMRRRNTIMIFNAETFSVRLCIVLKKLLALLKGIFKYRSKSN